MAEELTPLSGYDDPFEGHTGAEVEEFLKGKLKAHENAISNRATLGMSFEPAEDGTKGTLSISDAKAQTIVSCEIPMGGGQSSAEGIAVTRLTASVDKGTLRTGDDCTLTYSYDNIYSGGPTSGEPTGRMARIEIEIVGASMATLFKTTLRNVSRGSYALAIGKYMQDGDNAVYVRAYVADDDGTEKMRQAYAKVTALSIALENLFAYDEMVNTDGYDEDQSISVPWAVSGPGNKTVLLYVDGLQAQTRAVTKDGVSRGTFQLSGLLAGRHVVQIVAEAERDGVTVRSASYFIDIYVRDGATDGVQPFVCVMGTRADGSISTAGAAEFVPGVEIQARSSIELTVAAVGGATLELAEGDSVLQSLDVSAKPVILRHRFTTEGDHNLVLCLGEITRQLRVIVTAPDVEISEVTDGLTFKLEGAGGVDSAFALASGRERSVECRPFVTDVRRSGMTLEVTFKATRPVDRSLPLMDCTEPQADGTVKGLRITGEEIAYHTGQSVEYTNEDGATATREIKLSSAYATGEWYKAAFVVRPSATGAGDRLMELYMNGDRVAADIYDATFDFRQSPALPLLFSAAGADVEVRSVRMYSRALSDDEMLDNHIADIRDTDEMVEAYQANDVLTASGVDVDIAKLMARGKGVLRVVRKGKLTDVFAANDKKADFLSDVIFTSPFGESHSFTIRNCFIRIQGTSSTKYPAKNLRIYFTKGTGVEMTAGGENVTKWPIRPGATPVSLICLKADYSDSSMSLNTGGARLFNDVMQDLDLLTPPQRWQKEQGGDITVRAAIDGYPIDVFVSETDDGAAEYVGQYNLNNEKSKSGALFGMEKVEGYTPACPLALEFLNNSSPVCLFDTTDDDALAAAFDGGAEINYPDDVKWAGMTDAQRTAVKRLWGWLRECKPAGANPANISSYASAKFRAEALQYIDVDYNIAYYLQMDYMAAVDQFAKNILFRTWDGFKWYATYYDGDTKLGKRNDCFLKYHYTVDRESRDDEMSKWAMEGHDSLLWNLLQANFAAEFRAMAQRLREKMTTERVLGVFNDEQCGHWPTRQFNKSGELKYILPATVGTPDKTGAMQKWPYIYALQGSNTPHRTFFIRNRFALLDARYGVSSAHDDNIDLYLARAASDKAERIVITAAEDYVFGYGTNNSPDIFTSGLVRAGETVEIVIPGAYTINDPLRIYGASKIRKLDMRGACSHLKNGFILNRCTALQELDLSVGASATPSEAWNLGISGCHALRLLNLNGQTHARTSASSAVLDLTGQTRLESLDARGTQASGVLVAAGAPVTSLRLPATVSTLILENNAALTASGLQIADGASLGTISVKGCPALDVRGLVETAIAGGTLKTLTLEGVEWGNVTLSLLDALQGVQNLELSGMLTLADTEALDAMGKVGLMARFGDIDSATNPLCIVYKSIPLNGRTLTVDGPAEPPVGKTDYRLQPVFNDVRAVAWTMAGGNLAEVDSLGTVTVHAKGAEAEAPTAAVAAAVTLSDGTAVSASKTVRLYTRTPKVGDYVWADGSTSLEWDSTKTCMGVYFGTYTSGGQTFRFCVRGVPDYISDAVWGLSPDSFPDLTLNSDPDFDVFLVNKQKLTWWGMTYLLEDFITPITTLPGGQYAFCARKRCLEVMTHRDMVLSDLGLPLPYVDGGTAVEQRAKLDQCIAKVVADNGNNSAYRQFYYPKISYALLYEPSVKAGESLATCFSLGHWFMDAADLWMGFQEKISEARKTEIRSHGIWQNRNQWGDACGVDEKDRSTVDSATAYNRSYNKNSAGPAGYRKYQLLMCEF